MGKRTTRGRADNSALSKQQYRVSLINDWNNMKRSDITKLVRRAARGDKLARSQMLRYSWAISSEANQRMDYLEMADKAYGGSYNRVKYYLDIQFESDRALNPVQMKLDYYDMREQNDQLVKWLTKDVSTVEGQVRRERHRLEKLKELNIVDWETDYRDAEEFLRWLGNEEISASLDGYGTSEILVDAFYDVYKEQGKKGLDILSKAFTEFQARKYSKNPMSFDDAMERAGVKLEDYIEKHTK